MVSKPERPGFERIVRGENEGSSSLWKDFLLEHKWLPTTQLTRRFGIQQYDVDNFRRKPSVRTVLDPWRISLCQPPDRLRAILTKAWEYYITQVVGLDLAETPRTWVPQLISLKNVSRAGEGFSFLTNSKYLELTCPDELATFRQKGLTNVALATHEFWPGRQRLSQAGVLPFMFHQTHRSTLAHLDIESMVEHIYLNYLADEQALESAVAIIQAKERLYVRHDEHEFLTQDDFSRFGVPYNFCKDVGGLRTVLKSLAAKYAVELGYSLAADTSWSASEFRRRFPERVLDTCEYCGLRPVDLHHLVPRETQPSLVYESDNVVALCVQAHGYITRRHWTSSEAELYGESVKKWPKGSPGSRQEAFHGVMGAIHATIYGCKE